MIKSQVTLKQLEAFVAVVDSGTFRRAARDLGTTQPNISARIAALEQTLDTVLMHRDAASLRLTERGETLLAAARDVLWSAEQFLEKAKRQDLVAERLRLGVTELVACTWLHDFLRAFKADYPKVRVELEVDLSREIEKGLNARQIDLALQTGPFQQEMSGSLALGSYRYGWVAQPQLAAKLAPSGAFESLFDHPILTHGRHTITSAALSETATERGLPTQQIMHSSSLSSCLRMAEDGMGIAMLPEVMTAPLVRAGSLVPIDCGWAPQPLEFFARYDAATMPRFVHHAAALAKDVSAGARA